MRSPLAKPVTCHLPHVMLQPSLPRRSAAKAGPTQSSPVQVSPTESNLCEADCESDVRPTCNQEPATCNLPPSAASVSLCLKASPTQSKPVKPWELEWGGDSLSPQHHCRTPQPQRKRPPSHSSFVIRHFALSALYISVAQSVFHLCPPVAQREPPAAFRLNFTLTHSYWRHGQR